MIFQAYQWNTGINGIVLQYQPPPASGTSNTLTIYAVNTVTGAPTKVVNTQTFDPTVRPWYTACMTSCTPTTPYVLSNAFGSSTNTNVLMSLNSKLYLGSTFLGVATTFYSVTPTFPVTVLSTLLQQFNTVFPNPFVVIYIMQTSNALLLGTNVNENLNFTKTAYQASNTYITMSAQYIQSNKITTATTQEYNGNVISVNFVSAYTNQYVLTSFFLQIMPILPYLPFVCYLFALFANLLGTLL